MTSKAAPDAPAAGDGQGIALRLTSRPVDQELKSSFMDYAMSVIVSRALPDARDGLKPVHRRILYAMNELGATADKPTRKSARIVGEVLGKFHPHGESSVYDAMARMAQDFSLRYPLIQGQGNWGCFTGDTRIRLRDGTDRSFQELSALGPKATFWACSVDANGRIVAGRGRNARVTRQAAELVAVELDNGVRVRCTPDHRFLLRDGSYKEARLLTPHDSLMPGYFESFEEFLVAAENYNHRVVSVEVLREREDVYDIEVDEHHNFLLTGGVFVHNSVDGDPPAAQRYTEARLASIAMEMLVDIEKETVDLVPNFDASLQEPTLLPAKLPNLLVNGSSGIAVGMATNVPPHNLGEVVDAIIRVIDHPESHLNDILQHIKGPDFPTGGIVMGRAGLVEAYANGRGRITVRGRVNQERVRDRNALIFTELPYMVNKSSLLVSIADLVKDKRVEGISDLRDESSREGIRVVVELKKDANADVVLNQLYTHTQLQTTFSVLTLALVKNRPVVLALKRLIEEFNEHRVQVVTRRTQFDLKKAEERAHIVDGLLTALDHIDAVVQLIRQSRTPEDAKTGLMARYNLSEIQAKAILDMRLAKLAALEVKGLKDERDELARRILRYRQILASRAEILSIIKDELRDVKKRFGDPRRTEIAESEAEEIDLEELIPEHDVVVTVTNAGYIKRSPLAAYRSQGRGGKGIIGTETKEEDFVVDLFVSSTHRYIMFFTTRGQVHWLKGFEIPEASRYGRGKAIVNLLQGLQPGERITAAIPVQEFRDDRFVVFATKQGIVKRVVLSDFKHVRAGGIRAIQLEPGDDLIGVALTNGGQDIVLAKKNGQAVRFNEDEVRAMGRTAVGVWGTRCEAGDEVVALGVLDGSGDLLTIKANGRGKRTPVQDYPVKHRGTQGVITITTEETVDGRAVTSPVVSMVHVKPGDEVIVSTEGGKVIRVPVDSIPQKGRAAQGNWIIRPGEGDRVVAVARVVSESILAEAAPTHA